MKKLFVLALIIGVIMLVQWLQQERANWQGLTRTEAEEKLRGRLAAKLEGKVDEEQFEGIVSAVLDGMMTKGIVVADPVA